MVRTRKQLYADEILINDTNKTVKEKSIEADSHRKQVISSEIGSHGLRFYNDTLQFLNKDDTWIDIQTGSGGVPPSNIIQPRIKIGNGQLTIYWSDPGDTIVDGQTICTWKGTKLVQKIGAYPENIKDGKILIDNRELNAYKDNGFQINNLTNGTTYYFALFPYSDKNAVNDNQANRLVGTPQDYKVMTAKIDLSNSNPATCITYADDAVHMTEGSFDWDEFFGHYPVLFKDGVEVGKLKTTDFTKFEDGTSADITSGNAGDVMIAFPRRGVRITTVGNILTVSMTDDPEDENFEYLAHSRGNARREKFYLGSYKGHVLSSKLRSLSGKTPTASQTIGTFRTQAQANGTGYEQSGFYQLIFRQCMYLLKYKNLDSQTTIGRGYVKLSNSASITTGNTNAYGMDCEIIKSTNPSYMADEVHQVKLFGLEDFWGNVQEWIDGVYSNSTRNILTSTDNFNTEGIGYIDQGQSATADIGNYMSKPQGTTKTGFIAKEVSGSESTYFCDYGSLYATRVACFGGNWDTASYAGVFRLRIDDSASSALSSFAARLMYL